MKIDKIYIKNFRSIKNTTVDFDKDFKILIGKNEAGKSNVLNALSYLNSEKKYDQDDIREPLPEEEEVEESTIGFRFKFSQKGKEEVFNKIAKYIYTKSFQEKIIKDYSSKEYFIRDLCSHMSSGIHTVDLINESRKTQYYSLLFSDKWSFVGDWVKLKKGQNSPFGEKPFKIFNKKDINTDLYDRFEPITVEGLYRIIGQEVINYIKANLPEVLFWSYKEENLLPSSIPIVNFTSNPESYIPLKNMFNLAGIDNISEKISEAQNGRSNRLENLLSRVAKKTTEHFKDIWPEYKQIKFSLSPNGTNIEVRIQEKNKFHLDQRSDGFKRFITFLLYISATAQSEYLSDKLILIDEPDLGLHPSGIRLLRNRLIEISKSNQIIVTTHSIFMIDNEDIDRHYIIEKKNEITETISPNDDNILTEEVLFRALGYSIYDTLKSTIILFEGWKDKFLFKTAIASTPQSYIYLKKEYAKIGISHSKGVKHIKNLTPFFELANRKCFIISDNDTPAIEKQKEFKKEKFYGSWLRYNEIDSSRKEKTGEDFLKPNYLDKTWDKIKSSHNIPDEIILNHSSSKGVIDSLKKELSSKKITAIKDIIDDFKDQLFEGLSRINITDNYYELLVKLSKIINSKD
ncbi:ATP-dependent nuclease [Pseudotenacibaculum haliotis]|uniref:ATP-dependent endonuclease n=1 Tax=Pseudotenacibaculum haliotis TaxID=1862138 RepID=A0ABW5LVJ1_9FLAO